MKVARWLLRHANGSLMAQSSQYRLPETDVSILKQTPTTGAAVPVPNEALHARTCPEGHSVTLRHTPSHHVAEINFTSFVPGSLHSETFAVADSDTQAHRGQHPRDERMVNSQCR